MPDQTTRDLIVESADALFYRRGYEHTSFADIAQAVQISRGNFYYHFKSKDEILDAVIAKRLDDRRAMLARWESECAHPADRIRRYIDILITNHALIRHYGCPVGMLCSELAKLEHPSRGEANAVFTLFRDWLRKQFSLLGHPRHADALAMHLIGRSQGIAVMSNAFQDETFVRKEVQLLHEWLDSYVAAESASSRKGWPAKNKARKRTGPKTRRRGASTQRRKGKSACS